MCWLQRSGQENTEPPGPQLPGSWLWSQLVEFLDQRPSNWMPETEILREHGGLETRSFCIEMPSRVSAEQAVPAERTLHGGLATGTRAWTLV